MWAASFSMQILPLSWIDWLTNASWANYALPSLALGLLILRALVLCAVLWRSLPQQLPMQFSLDGEVNRPGIYPYAEMTD